MNQGFATETDRPIFSGGALACRIFSKNIYRALGAENIRHRRAPSPKILMQRLLSLDYVLEHPELTWLPAEPEKVRCFEATADSGGRIQPFAGTAPAVGSGHAAGVRTANKALRQIENISGSDCSLLGGLGNVAATPWVRCPSKRSRGLSVQAPAWIRPLMVGVSLFLGIFVGS